MAIINRSSINACMAQANQGGFWYPHEAPKTVTELVTEYEDSVGHNSNFLLELSPDPRGRIPSAGESSDRQDSCTRAD